MLMSYVSHLSSESRWDFCAHAARSQLTTLLQRLYSFLCYTLPCQVEWQTAEAGAALHLAAERGILDAQEIMQKQQATPICDYLDRSYEPVSEMGKNINCAIKYQHQSNDKVR